MTEKILYVFGDSYSTTEYVDPKDSFWGLAAKDLAIDTIYNFSFSGNCLDNIIHVLLNEEYDFDNGYFLIGIPPLIRYSIWNHLNDNNPQFNKPVIRFDKDFNNSKQFFTSMQNVGSMQFAASFNNDKEFVSYFSSQWSDVLNLEKIYLLDNYLKTKNCKFIIVNLSWCIGYHESWPSVKKIMASAKALSSCILFNDSFHDINLRDKIKPVDFSQFGDNGHYGNDGNTNWYNKVIKPKMQELKWL
jgi:hypothetical protein